jgi:hypothetical protein
MRNLQRRELGFIIRTQIREETAIYLHSGRVSNHVLSRTVLHRLLEVVSIALQLILLFLVLGLVVDGGLHTVILGKHLVAVSVHRSHGSQKAHGILSEMSDEGNLIEEKLLLDEFEELPPGG